MPRASKKDPFADDEEEKVEESSSEPEEEGKPKSLSVEGDPNEEEGGSDEEKEERKERRRNRFKEAQEGMRAAEERAARLDSERTEALARAAAAEQVARQAAEWSQRQAQPQKDPWEQAIENEVISKRSAIRAEMENLRNANTYTPQEQQRLANEWQRTEVRQTEILMGKQLYYRDMQQRQQAPQQQQAAAEAALTQQIRMRYPDIVNNPKAYAYMEATFLRSVNAEQKPNDWNTADHAAQEARRAFRLGAPPPPDAATKARYSGIGGGANGHVNGNGGGGKIEMLPKFKKMARALYPDMPAHKAEEKWAKTAGKKILEGDG
jgi:hypothetical protein